MRTYEEILKSNSERYYWLKEHGICVNCGGSEAEPGKTLCFECAEKNRVRHNKCMTENREKKRQRDRDRYNRLKEKGVCVKCHMRPAAEGYVRCDMCRRLVNRKRTQERREKGVLPEDMRGNGVYCYACLKEVEVAGSRLCNNCLERCRANVANARKFRNLKNHWWKKDNNLIFKNGGNNEEV